MNLVEHVYHAHLYDVTLDNIYTNINCFLLFRMYALRKIRYEFKESKTLTDEEKIRQCYAKGQETLAMIKRQVVLGDLYSTRPLVIEKQVTWCSDLEYKIVLG